MRESEWQLTRQFIVEDGGDNHQMSQLSFRFHYPPTAPIARLGASNRWLHDKQNGVADWLAFVRASAGFGAPAAKPATNVTLDWSPV